MNSQTNQTTEAAAIQAATKNLHGTSRTSLQIIAAREGVAVAKRDTATDIRWNIGRARVAAAKPTAAPQAGHRWSWVNAAGVRSDAPDGNPGQWVQTRSAQSLRWLVG